MVKNDQKISYQKIVQDKEKIKIQIKNHRKALRVQSSPAIPRVFIHDQLFLCGVEGPIGISPLEKFFEVKS